MHPLSGKALKQLCKLKIIVTRGRRDTKGSLPLTNFCFLTRVAATCMFIFWSIAVFKKLNMHKNHMLKIPVLGRMPRIARSNGPRKLPFNNELGSFRRRWVRLAEITTDNLMAGRSFKEQPRSLT